MPGRIPALVPDDVDQGVLRTFPVGGYPVANRFNSMLFEQAHGVIAEAGIEVVQFAGVGDVCSEFVHCPEAIWLKRQNRSMVIAFFMAEVFVGLTGCDERMIHDSERKDFNDQSEGLEN